MLQIQPTRSQIQIWQAYSNLVSLSHPKSSSELGIRGLRYHPPFTYGQGGNCAFGTRVSLLISVICFMFYLSNLFCMYNILLIFYIHFNLIVLHYIQYFLFMPHHLYLSKLP
jgi:hypothetical protein